MKHRRLPRERLRELSFTKLIPNMLTLLGLCAGLTAIRFSLTGQWEAAVAAILLASLLDTLDGGMARLLGVGSSFGAELDSLADLVSFGVAPAVMVYAWTMNDAGSIGWALTLGFCVCSALRLARFNTALESDAPPPWAYRYFTGVPTPAGAGMVLLPMLLSFQFPDMGFGSVFLNGVVIIAVSGLMVGRMPTYSLKSIRVPHKYVLPTMVLVALMAGFAVGSPWATLTAVLAIYLVSMPFSYVTYKRAEKRATQAANPDAATPDTEQKHDTDQPA
jgi:CDP-diacylglycerol---serine O-phosphatidyltransferase